MGLRERSQSELGLRLRRLLRDAVPHDRGASTNDAERLQIILAEYTALREEILRRMDHRMTTLVTSLTVSGALIAVGVERESAPLLLVVPVVAALFGLLIIYHILTIREIGIYIEAKIERPLRLTYADSMSWHSAQMPPDIRIRRLIGIGYVPVALATLVPSFIGLTLPWSFKGGMALKIALFSVGVLTQSYYVFQYYTKLIRYTNS
jgi:hypothetical protein